MIPRTANYLLIKMETISNPKRTLTLLSAQHLVADAKPSVERVKMRVARDFIFVYDMGTVEKRQEILRKLDSHSCLAMTTLGCFLFILIHVG